MKIQTECEKCFGSGVVPQLDGSLIDCLFCGGDGKREVEGVVIPFDYLYKIIKEIKELRRMCTKSEEKNKLNNFCDAYDQILGKDGLDGLRGWVQKRKKALESE